MEMRFETGVLVALTALVQSVCAEVLQVAGNASTRAQHQRLTPRDITNGIRDDPELFNFAAHPIQSAIELGD
jgi:hypothetical protein